MRAAWERPATGIRPPPSDDWAGAAPRPILLPVAGDRGRVVVADDDVLLREGLGSLLVNSGFDLFSIQAQFLASTEFANNG